MNVLLLPPANAATWTINAEPLPNGIALVVGFPLNGESTILRFELDRAEARKFADGILAAAGDGTMRTFPHPQPPEVAGG